MERSGNLAANEGSYGRQTNGDPDKDSRQHSIIKSEANYYPTNKDSAVHDGYPPSGRGSLGSHHQDSHGKMAHEVVFMWIRN
ncbi:hypothetical protein BV898_02181 [Hypsibius exemplaris]|uniref:Uncharacterized protein n=1 Tax=Hypsibius exemplaris TaxID=2072580 RepID=A0A1W0X8H6_HYPEX|nr:hypothetical protein BV898_02181 [Hypsibius exemplaris]